MTRSPGVLNWRVITVATEGSFGDIGVDVTIQFIQRVGVILITYVVVVIVLASYLQRQWSGIDPSSRRFSRTLVGRTP